MRIFGRMRESASHAACVIYTYERRGDLAYYSAVCDCGWFAEPVDAAYPDRECEERMALAALEHDPTADTTVAFPMDDPRR